MEAFEAMVTAKPELQCTVSNIQYHYECKDAVDRENNLMETQGVGTRVEADEEEEEEGEGIEDGGRLEGQHEGEEELRKFIASQELAEEMIHGWQAIEIVKGTHILPEQHITWDNTGNKVKPATTEDLSKFVQWSETLARCMRWRKLHREEMKKGQP